MIYIGFWSLLDNIITKLIQFEVHKAENNGIQTRSYVIPSDIPLLMVYMYDLPRFNSKEVKGLYTLVSLTIREEIIIANENS